MGRSCEACLLSLEVVGPRGDLVAKPPRLLNQGTSLQGFPRKEPVSKASPRRNLAGKTSQGRDLAAKYPKWDVRDSGPHRNISGKTPIQYRLIPEPFRNPKTTFLYMKLYLRTLPELLVISRILSGTPNNLRSHHYNYPKATIALPNFKCVTLRVREQVDMIETPLRSITISGTWMPIMTPTSSTKIVIGVNHNVNVFHFLCLTIFYLPEI